MRADVNQSQDIMSLLRSLEFVWVGYPQLALWANDMAARFAG